MHTLLDVNEKARIPTKSVPNCVKKLVNLHQVWRALQKNAKKPQERFERRREEFILLLHNLFDITHADALRLINIEEDKIFLQRQREPGRPSQLAGVDRKHAEKEERARQRAVQEENRRVKYLSTASTSTACVFTQAHVQTDSSSSSDEDVANSQEQLSVTQSKIIAKRGRKDIVTPKLEAALYRCQ